MTDDEFIAQLSQHERLLHSISVTFARGDAEVEKDIYQEILYNLWRTRDRYNGQCSIKNWLYRVGLNTAISLWRQEKKRVQTTPITPLMEETVADEPSAPLYDELYRLIDHLTKNDQALVSRRWCFSTSTAPPRRRWPPFSAFRKPTWVSASTA